MKQLKNILLISGSGRNCGKTTLACHLIGQLAKEGVVFGLKITPHFHLTGRGQQLLAEGDGFRIFRETDRGSGKDSTRMLKAGAGEVYFIQSTDEHLTEVYEHLKNLLPPGVPVVCESGAFAAVFSPGLHLLVKGPRADESKQSYRRNLEKADFILTQQDFSLTGAGFQVDFKGNGWTIQKTQNDQIRRSA
ncbi:MAG: hypothetical protein L3J66_07715 [Bacteroidales bacterium]|nr:hypothetical protein [Bacteroidales bacterium]